MNHTATATQIRMKTKHPLTRFALTLAPLLLLTLGVPPAFTQVRGSVEGNAHPPLHESPALPTAGDPMPVHPTAAESTEITDAQWAAFAQAVDLSPLRTLAIFDGGRAKILDTYARETLIELTGKPRYRRVQIRDDGTLDKGAYREPLFTLLDLALAKPRYHHQPLIHIEVLPLRRSLVEAVIPPNQRETYLKLGRLTPLQLTDRRVDAALSQAAADLRLRKGLDQLMVAGQMYDGATLSLGAMRMVNPPTSDDKWMALSQLHDASLASADSTSPPNMPAFEPHAGRQVLTQINALADAWIRADADAVNVAAAALADLLPTLNPATYPSTFRRAAELWYNRTGKFTIGFWAYFLAAVVMLIALGARRRTLATLGIGLLGIGLAAHTAGIVIRMLLADRNWLPLHNQYESFIALVWFGVIVGVTLMVLRRQLIFGPAAAALGAVSLMVAGFLPIPSNEIAPVAGILATSNILKVHVTIVLASYGLIALGFLISLCLLAVHYFGDRTSATVAAAGVGIVTLGDGRGNDDAGGDVAPGPQRLTADLDQAQMVVLQLAFYLLGLGILLGAYWADHAWGRWWAWDPKETWALITWIVYLIVIHLRFAVRRRALVTAWLSVVGFFVMLWTYWGVNLLLAGLHSYA